MLLIGALLGLGSAAHVSAHAEPERAIPPINGVVDAAPAVVEIWFSEEAKTEGTTIIVIGPGGIQVDMGDAKVDLNDPERKHVTVSLRPNLGPGAYTVQWHSVSGTDGDSAQGGYLFTVGSGGTPDASPAATPQGGVTNAEATAEISPTVELVASPESTAAAEEGDFDGQAFALSVGAGLVAAVGIFLFWRWVRPKDPKFRG
jgi:methionine-rich copper-binding protein CopC